MSQRPRHNWCGYCGEEILPSETLTVGNLTDPDGESNYICLVCLDEARREARRNA